MGFKSLSAKRIFPRNNKFSAVLKNFSATVTTQIDYLLVFRYLFYEFRNLCDVRFVKIHERIVHNEKRLFAREHVFYQAQTET